MGQSPEAPFHSLSNAVADHFSGEKFQFICIQNPDDAKNRATRRLARSHAIARGLEKKRRRLQQAGRNFRTVSLKDETGSKSEEIVHKKDVSPVLLSIAAPGPFQLLAAESPSLQALISQRKFLSMLKPLEIANRPIQTVVNVLQNQYLVSQTNSCSRTFSRFFERDSMTALYCMRSC